MVRQVSTRDWHEVLEGIGFALNSCDRYPEQFANDTEAQTLREAMLIFVDQAGTLAERIRDREDAWSDAAEGIERKDEAELRRQQREDAGV